MLSSAEMAPKPQAKTRVEKSPVRSRGCGIQKSFRAFGSGMCYIGLQILLDSTSATCKDVLPIEVVSSHKLS